MEQVWRMYLFLCTPFNQKRAARMHSISTHTSMLMWRVSSLLWNNLWRRIMIAKFRNWRVAWLPEKSSARCSASFRRDDKAHINQTRLSQIILVWDDDVYLARPSTKPKHLVSVFPLDPSSVRSIACKSCMKKTSCTRVMNCCAVARFVLVIHTHPLVLRCALANSIKCLLHSLIVYFTKLPSLPQVLIQRHLDLDSIPCDSSIFNAGILQFG